MKQFPILKTGEEIIYSVAHRCNILVKVDGSIECLDDTDKLKTWETIVYSDKGNITKVLKAPKSVTTEPSGIVMEPSGIVMEPSGGKKSDGGKLDWTLIPWKALIPAVKVLMFGANKYGRENWKKVSLIRYERALLRHVLSDELNDEETGLPHLAHAMCCILFIITLRGKGKNE